MLERDIKYQRRNAEEKEIISAGLRSRRYKKVFKSISITPYDGGKNS